MLKMFASKNIRIIPRLDIKGPHIVKGIHLEGLRVLGNPEEFAKHYYETGADELIYMDVVASLYNRNSLHDIIKKTSREIFVPLTVGGGLRTIEDIRTVLLAGADKISLNTAAILNPQLVREAARKFGSSTILISIEAIKQSNGKYFAFTDNGREYTGVEVLDWAKQVEEFGAGEIMITSIDKEGTGSGYDIDLTRMISNAVSIPVIASGGAGKLNHISEVITEGLADAVAIASMLHYEFAQNSRMTIDTTKEGNVDFLKSGRVFSMVNTSTLDEIKNYLNNNNVNCRLNS